MAMPSRTEFIAAARDYLALVLERELPATDLLPLLMQSLDRLALCCHSVAVQFDERDFPDAPVHDYAQTRAIIGDRFPTLGYYNVAAEIAREIGATTVNTGDAIDDLTDIATDLRAVLWYCDNTSMDDALFHFTWSFRSHWGRHLRELQLYLHDLCYR
jgi:hypothetical protein